MKPEITESQNTTETLGNTTETLGNTAAETPEETAAASATQPEDNDNSLSFRGANRMSIVSSSLSGFRGAIAKIKPQTNRTNATNEASNAAQNENNSAPQSNDTIYTAKKFIAEEYYSRKYTGECKADTSKDKVFLNMLPFIDHTNVLIRELIWQLDDPQEETLESAELEKITNRIKKTNLQNIQVISNKKKIRKLKRDTQQLKSHIHHFEEYTTIECFVDYTGKVINIFLLLEQATKDIETFQQIFKKNYHQRKRTNADISEDFFNKERFDILRNTMQNYSKALGLLIRDLYRLVVSVSPLSESAQRYTSPTNRDINQTIEFLNLAKEVIASLHSRSSVIGTRDEQELHSQQLITPGYIIDDYISRHPGATILDYHYYNHSTITLYSRAPTPSAREIAIRERRQEAGIDAPPTYEEIYRLDRETVMERYMTRDDVSITLEGLEPPRYDDVVHVNNEIANDPTAHSTINEMFIAFNRRELMEELMEELRRQESPRERDAVTHREEVAMEAAIPVVPESPQADIQGDDEIANDPTAHSKIAGMVTASNRSELWRQESPRETDGRTQAAAPSYESLQVKQEIGDIPNNGRQVR